MRRRKWLLVFLSMIILAGCGSVSSESLQEGSTEMSWVTVQATVEKVQGNVLYVQTKGNESFPSEYMTLSASLLGEDVLAKEGTVLEITCDGLVFETYPAQFGKVSQVKVISQTEEDTLEGKTGSEAVEETEVTEITKGTVAPEENGTWEKVEVAPPEGAYCTISFLLPEGWDWSWGQSEDVPVSCISIAIWPKAEGDENGSVVIEYAKGFGVCGTGLVSEEITFNGLEAWKGTYDNHSYWDFISLADPYRDCAIINNAGWSWFDRYEGELMQILSTVTFTMQEE